MRGLRLIRAVAIVATVGAGLAVTTAPAAGATPTRVVTSYLGANASFDYAAPGEAGSTWIWVQLTDELAGQGTLDFSRYIDAVDDDGNWLGPIFWQAASGTVQVEVDEHLRTAHAWGTVSVTSCNYASDPSCNWPIIQDSYLDATWTATTGAVRTHSVAVGSVSRTSRTIFHIGATSAFADAVLTLDGETLGQTTYPTQANIFDARYTTAEMYFGGNLPGTIKPMPPAGSGGHRATPSNGGPTEWPLGTTRTIDTDRVEASWYDSDTSTWRNFNAVYEVMQVHNLTTATSSAYYYEETSAGGQQIGTVSAIGSGDLGVAGSIGSASFSGTLQATVCTALSYYEQVCIDGVELPVDLTWTANGPVVREMSNQHGDRPDGGNIAWLYRNDHSPALASGTVGGVELPVSAYGLIGREHQRTDVYI